MSIDLVWAVLLTQLKHFQLNYSIKQFQVKSDFKPFWVKPNTLHAGVSVIRYKIGPMIFFSGWALNRIITPERQQVENGEYATYVGDHVDVNEKFALYAGLHGIRYIQ